MPHIWRKCTNPEAAANDKCYDCFFHMFNKAYTLASLDRQQFDRTWAKYFERLLLR